MGNHSYSALLDVTTVDTIVRTNCITSLTLTSLYRQNLDQLTTQIDLVGPHLRNLRLDGVEPLSVSAAPALLLARCEVLEFLAINLASHVRLHQILQNLPNPSLTTLQCGHNGSNADTDSTLALPSMKRMKKLDLTIWHGDLDQLEAESQLWIDSWGKRGLVITLATQH